MAVQLHELTLHLSGGAGNVDPNLSLGGVIATNGQVVSQNFAAPTLVTGVTILDSIGNALGGGSLAYTLTGTTLQWTPAGGSIGVAVDVSIDGTYTIQSAGVGYIVVAVVAASLPIANQTDADIIITNNKNGVFDDVSKAESFSGDGEYRCLYLRNDSAVDTVFDAVIWVAAQPTGADDMSLMVDAAGGGDGVSTGIAQTIANEDTVPSTGVFTAPVDSPSGLSLGQLAPGEVASFWIKRNVPALNIITTLGDVSAIGFKAFI